MTRHAGSYAREIKVGTAAASPNGFLAWGVIVLTTTGPPVFPNRRPIKPMEAVRSSSERW